MAYLRGFAQTATDPGSIQSKIGQIFGEVRNKFGNGYMADFCCSVNWMR